MDRTEAQQTTLHELLERYRREVTASKRGKTQEEYRLKVIQREPLARYAVASITSTLIATYRDERLKTVAGSTVAKELTLLSHAFSVAIREWGFGLHFNPVSRVRKPSDPPARDRVLSDEERDALLTACAGSRNPWIRPVVIFALETAARRGEILSLKWADVHLGTATAKVDGKTGPRVVPLSPPCIAMLKGLPRSLNGQVFPVTVDALKQAYERAVNRAELQDFTFHDLRHDALTRLAKRGFSVLELRAISGHTTANMLQRYVSIDAGDLARKLAAG
jgi:integrase